MAKRTDSLDDLVGMIRTKEVKSAEIKYGIKGSRRLVIIDLCNNRRVSTAKFRFRGNYFDYDMVPLSQAVGERRKQVDLLSELLEINLTVGRQVVDMWHFCSKPSSIQLWQDQQRWGFYISADGSMPIKGVKEFLLLCVSKFSTNQIRYLRVSTAPFLLGRVYEYGNRFEP